MLVERVRPSCLVIAGHVLYPGMNKLPDGLSDKIAQHPMFKEQVKLGFLKVVNVKPSEIAAPSPAPAPISKPSSMASVPEHDALADEILRLKTVKKAADIVSKTLSIGTLKIVVAKEKRKTVRDAAQWRLDEMLAVPEKQEKPKA